MNFIRETQFELESDDLHFIHSELSANSLGILSTSDSPLNDCKSLTWSLSKQHFFKLSSTVYSSPALKSSHLLAANQTSLIPNLSSELSTQESLFHLTPNFQDCSGSTAFETDTYLLSYSDKRSKIIHDSDHSSILPSDIDWPLSSFADLNDKKFINEQNSPWQPHPPKKESSFPDSSEQDFIVPSSDIEGLFSDTDSDHYSSKLSEIDHDETHDAEYLQKLEKLEDEKDDLFTIYVGCLELKVPVQRAQQGVETDVTFQTKNESRVARVINSIKSAINSQSHRSLSLVLVSRTGNAWSYDKDTGLMKLISPRNAFKVTRQFAESCIQETEQQSTTGTKPKSANDLRTFEKYFRVLEIIFELLRDDIRATKREIYYRDVNLFGSQSSVDSIIEDLACSFGVHRMCLHVDASGKGLVSGRIDFIMRDEKKVTIDHDDGGLIPNFENILFFCVETSAQFVLVVEKETAFRSLIQQKVLEKLKMKFGECLLVTGKGYPDVNTRRLLHQLSKTPITNPRPNVPDFSSDILEFSSDLDDSFDWDALANRTDYMKPESEPNLLESPVLNRPGRKIFILVDADPHGIHIACCYKFGSSSMKFDTAALVVPGIEMIGINATDWNDLGLIDDGFGRSASKLIALTSGDRKKILGLLSRKDVRECENVRRQLSYMLRMNYKCEIEAIDGNTLVSKYLMENLSNYALN
ncbi:endodeoxyribonuclease [Nowakowskiella sp. JEL0407]|nr:endodeoxyribonuclease [Nowakowskiella sp. JEL0407]